MLIYFVILVLLFFAATFSRPKNKSVFLFSLMCLILIAVFRGKWIGTDNFVYYSNFSSTTMNPSSWSKYTEFEPGYSWLMAVFKTYVENNFWIFRGISFIVYAAGVGYVINKYCKNPTLGLFFYVLFLDYTSGFNTMRQLAALGLICFTIPLLERKKNILLYEILVILITVMFHRTMVIMTTLPVFLYSTKINGLFQNKRLVISLLLGSYLFVFLSKWLYGLIPYFVQTFSFLGDRYVGYFKTSERAEETVSIISSFLNTAFAIYVVLVSPAKEKKRMLFICLVLGVLCQNILGAMSALFLRVSINLLLFRIILFANLWYSISNYKARVLFRWLVCFYGLVGFSNSMLKNFGDIVPYDLIAYPF